MDERARNLGEAVERSGEMVRMVLGQELPDPDLVSKQTVWDFDHHFTPGLVKYRKSVTEAGDYAALEWTGEGSIVRDLLGREWIDCLGGYGIYDLGIRNPEVLAAVRAQLDRNPMPTQELLDPFKGMLCRLLAQIAPDDLTNAFICNSGTEAIEGAMKIARVATGRAGFLCADGAFHGKTLGALSLMSKAGFREPVEPLLGPVFRIPFGDADAAERVLREHGNEIAAVVIEPIQGEEGARAEPVPPHLDVRRQPARVRGGDRLAARHPPRQAVGRRRAQRGAHHERPRRSARALSEGALARAGQRAAHRDGVPRQRDRLQGVLRVVPSRRSRRRHTDRRHDRTHRACADDPARSDRRSPYAPRPGPCRRRLSRAARRFA